MGKTRDQGNLVSEGRPSFEGSKLGIGTDNPSSSLDIIGSAKITGISTITNGLHVTSGSVGIGTDSNLTANLTIGSIEETSTTNKGALAIKTLSNSDSNIGESAIFIEESGSNYGFYHKASTYFSTTHYQLLESGSGNSLFTISDTGDVGIKTNYADTFALKILSEDENVIKIENNNNGIFGSDIRIFQDSNSPAANDKLLTLDVRGNDSGGNETTYVEAIASIEDPTNGSEDGKFTIQTRTAGTLTDRIVVDSGGVGIGTTNAVNAALHVEGRNFAFGGPGDNVSGEGNVYIGNYDNPLLDSYDRNVRIGSRNEIQIELYSAYTATEYSDSIIASSTSGIAWQFNANNGNSTRSGAYPFYYNMGNAKTDDYIFWQAGDRYLWFDADTGRLGINRSASTGWSDTLDVNGTARVTGVAKFDSNVCIAHTSTLHSGNLQVSTSGADAIDINSYSSSADNGGRLSFYRSKNATIGSNTIVADGDSLGRIDFRGYNSNGNSYDQGATIEAKVDGSVNSTTDMPSALVFKTSADGSSTPTERLRISSDGKIILTPGADSGNILQLNGADTTSEILEAGITSGHVQFTATHASGGSNTCGFIFRTRNGASGTTEKLRLESGGHLLGTSGARIVQEVLRVEWSGTPDARIYEMDIENFTNSGTSCYYYFRINAWIDIGNMASPISYDVWIHKRSATAVDMNVVKLTPWHSKAIQFYHYTADSGTGDKRFVMYFGEDYSGFSIIDYTTNSGRMKSTKGRWTNTLNDSAATSAISGYTAITVYEYSYT